jgi:hypothetical protein
MQSLRRTKKLAGFIGNGCLLRNKIFAEHIYSSVKGGFFHPEGAKRGRLLTALSLVVLHNEFKRVTAAHFWSIHCSES